MQVACQAGTREACASLRPPPNSLELFTLFSLPFLHFYNFLGTQVEWGGGGSLVLSGPRPGGHSAPFSPPSAPPGPLPGPPAERGSESSSFSDGFTVRHKPLKLPAPPHPVSVSVGTSVCSTQSPHTSVNDPDGRDRPEQRSGSRGAHSGTPCPGSWSSENLGGREKLGRSCLPFLLPHLRLWVLGLMFYPHVGRRSVAFVLCQDGCTSSLSDPGHKLPYPHRCPQMSVSLE